MAGRDDEGRDDARGDRGRRPLLASLVAVVVAVLVAGLVPPSAPSDSTTLPPLPVAPRGATEYQGRSSDGMAMTIRRVRDWTWIRVDSAESSACRVGGSIGKNYFSTSIAADATGAFGHEESYVSTVRTSRPLWSLFPRFRTDETLPKRVTVRLAGRFLPGGLARGSFERHDVADDEGDVVLDCERGVTWSARAVDP